MLLPSTAKLLAMPCCWFWFKQFLVTSTARIPCSNTQGKTNKPQKQQYFEVLPPKTARLTTISKIIKTGIICSYVTGSCIFLIPNNISIKINQTTFNRIYLPIFGGCLGTFAFIFSPFLIINYFINGTNLDKLYDIFGYTYDKSVIKEIIVFFEFFGPNSFAGFHIKEDPKELVMFDILLVHKNNNRKLIPPHDFTKWP
jgi:hypothetical protein